MTYPQEISGDTRAQLTLAYQTLEQPEQAYKLLHCRPDSRCYLTYCPTCAKWKSNKKSEALIKGLETIRDNHPRANLWAIGLTTKDVTLPSIHAEISRISKGWRQFQQHYLSDGIHHGWLRSFEACLSTDGGIVRKPGYDIHPHVHAIVAAKQRTRMPNAEELTEQWRLAAGLDYTPQVAYIEPVDSLVGYSKYILKHTDIAPILGEGADFFAEYEEQMRGRHLTQAGGMLAGIFGRTKGRFDTAYTD